MKGRKEDRKEGRKKEKKKKVQSMLRLKFEMATNGI